MTAMIMPVALMSLAVMCVNVSKVTKEMEHSVKVCLNLFIYYMHFINSFVLLDIDECQNETLNNCDDNADCFDSDGSFTCTCREGYSGTGVDCQGKRWILLSLCNSFKLLLTLDIDECESSDTNNCHPDASCSNTVGSFYCTCLPGFEGNGTSCTGTLKIITRS